jgi:hypothetical protein
METPSSHTSIYNQLTIVDVLSHDSEPVINTSVCTRGLHVLSHDSEPVINTSVWTRGLHVLSHDSEPVINTSVCTRSQYMKTPSSHTSIYNRLIIVA